MAPLRRVFVCALAAMPLVAVGADNVTITVSSSAPAAAFARAGDSALTVVVLLGETVTLARHQGQTYTLLGAGGLGGARFDTQPRDGEVVRITPEADPGGDGYRLHLDVRRWRADSQQHFSSTVAAMPGEWIRLWGEEPVQGRQVKRFASAPADRSLFVMVQP